MSCISIVRGPVEALQKEKNPSPKSNRKYLQKRRFPKFNFETKYSTYKKKFPKSEVEVKDLQKEIPKSRPKLNNLQKEKAKVRSEETYKKRKSKVEFEAKPTKE